MKRIKDTLFGIGETVMGVLVMTSAAIFIGMGFGYGLAFGLSIFKLIGA